MSDTQAAPAAPTPERPPPANVIQAIARVMEEMPGVGRDSTAAPAQGGYAYRSIEAITAAAQHLLGKYGVVFVPKVIERRMPVVELSVNGKPWTEEQLTVLYTVYGPGGVDDRIEVGPLVALGRDNVDKGTNKCMTQAFKYALLQVLAIGDNKDDADGSAAAADAHASRPVDPEQWFVDHGWMDKAHHDDRRKAIAELLRGSESPIKTAFRRWYDDQTEAPAWRSGWPFAFAELVEARLQALIDERPIEAPEAPSGTTQPPAPETPAPAPESPAGEADSAPDPESPGAPAAEWVEWLPPTLITELLLRYGLPVGGTRGARNKRLVEHWAKYPEHLALAQAAHRPAPQE